MSQTSIVAPSSGRVRRELSSGATRDGSSTDTVARRQCLAHEVLASRTAKPRHPTRRDVIGAPPSMLGARTDREGDRVTGRVDDDRVSIAVAVLVAERREALERPLALAGVGDHD